ncbi:hypothetical protein [Klebsiella aerogenes]|uniref:hypothetical protein n=1 Tax=Klebsiella aerogenes TaxID=548 RepID=UPI002A8087DB|nr:hypothetical protein [Klebsiella aerogenes]WPR86362.1 hypothetical protein SM788_06485 [Klebsiella aerogenes]
MTDITRLLASLKRRSSHVKDFGDDITFVKLEDLDALVEAMEKAQSANAAQDDHINQQQDRIEQLEKRNAELGKYAKELESFRTAYMEWSDKTDWVQGDKRFDVLIPWGKHRADVLKAYIERLESRTVTVKLPPLNDDLISILGRPNFMCAHLAELLRKSGEDIKRKSEHEQAAIIHWLLGIYLEHGDKWEDIAKSDIQARAAGIKWEAE